jgi:hypothetical protein
MKIVTRVERPATCWDPTTRMTTDTRRATRRVTVILRGGGDTTLGVDELTRRWPRTPPTTCSSKGLLAGPRAAPDYPDLHRRRQVAKKTPAKKRPVQVFVDDSLYGTPEDRPGMDGSSYQPYIARPVRPTGAGSGVYRWDSAHWRQATSSPRRLRSAGVARPKVIGHQDAR